MQVAKSHFNGKVKRAILFISAVCSALTFWAFAFAWPDYEWEGVINSPDGRFSLVVLREDPAAFADFSYHIYCFEGKPSDRAKHEIIRPFQTWLWRPKRLYEGDLYYSVSWVGPQSINIELSRSDQSERDIPRSHLCETEKVVVTRTFQG